jgi:hypothetical protein
MKNGLLDITIVSFVFTPLVVTVLMLLAIWRKRIRESIATMGAMDTPGLLVASAVCRLPEDRVEWGAAMVGELSQIHGLISRWQFALGCVRVALFPPHREGVMWHALSGHSPVCGMLAVALPPLGLPFIYFTAVIMEIIGGSPFTQSSSWSNSDTAIEVANIIVRLTLFSLLAGLPLGLVGLLRRERMRWLSVMGMFSSLFIISYFVTVMHFIAGGANGD